MDHEISNELPPLNSENNRNGNMPVPADAIGATERNEVQAAKDLESSASVGGGTQQPPTFAAPAASQTATAQQPMPATTAQGTNPVIADDADLIEKEWVMKAKEIVERTKQDPYVQNKEVEQMKADYMKKRYNKDIKLTED